jgi:glycine/D-amino acid oxidase-like deaminating enzyme
MNIIVVGTGICGCLSALHLAQHKHSIKMLSMGPDPRLQPNGEHYSATWNGAGARFVTAWEAHPFSGDNTLYPDTTAAFTRPVQEGGWLAYPLRKYTALEKAWLEARVDRPPRPAHDRAIYRYYEQNNAHALVLWQEMISDQPELFHNTDLHDQGIVRVYDSTSDFQQAILLHEKAGLNGVKLSSTDVATRVPALASACHSGHIVGGLSVDGITFNIHQLTQNLLAQLDELGVRIAWNTTVRGVCHNEAGDVTALTTSAGNLSADAYALHLGAYALPKVLHTVMAQNSIGGVAGRWCLMPRPSNLTYPIKIHGCQRHESGQSYPAFDISLVPLTNRTTGREYLAAGGGYIYLGFPPYQGKGAEAMAFTEQEIDRILSVYLGGAYRDAVQSSQTSIPPHTCVRSFTIDDAPHRMTYPCSGGGVMVVYNGTNTGSTALAPIIARDVARLIAQAGY